MKPMISIKKIIFIAIPLLVTFGASHSFAQNDNTSGGALQSLVPSTPSAPAASPFAANNTTTTTQTAMPATASSSTSTTTTVSTNNNSQNNNSQSSPQTTAAALSGLAAAVGTSPADANNPQRLQQIAMQQQQQLQAASQQGAAATATAGSSTLSPSDQISEDAFQTAAKAALPMTPDQIQRLRKLFSASQFAAAALPTTPPRPVARSQFVNLAPGATPPPIRLSQGIVTTLLFVDSTGAPWPIDAYDVGDPATYNIQWNKIDNMLMIQPNKLYGYGNIAIKLKGLNTPVMLTLTPPQLSDKNAVDYRVDLHVPGMGPNANPLPNGQGFTTVETPDLLGVLSGVPPGGAKTLIIPDADSQAWLVGDKLYVRTRLTILSPGWLSTLSSPDGMKAYLLQMTPTLVVSKHGKETLLKIEGF
jgi:intracellular multiplication protein IcmK